MRNGGLVGRIGNPGHNLMYWMFGEIHSRHCSRVMLAVELVRTAFSGVYMAGQNRATSSPPRARPASSFCKASTSPPGLFWASVRLASPISRYAIPC